MGSGEGAVRARATGGPNGARLCVLASGSGGNCSVLVAGGLVTLIDAGLSPRRTRRELDALGLSLGDVGAMVLTHLDTDHAYPGWAGAIPEGCALWVHRRHLGRAERTGLLRKARCEAFEDGFALGAARVSPLLVAHDSLGVASLRFEFACGASLGWATDVGRVTEPLVRHLRGTDVLAIESNYCPAMQRASGRPEFLKRRIMGGSGHLSNQECLEAVRRMGPRRHVVALHLSRQCNRPELVAGLHEGAAYSLTVTAPDRAIRWVEVSDRGAGVVVPGRPTAPLRS
ncbi:MAG: MBL fold metallo-hydrolase [Phycisphaerae bacterium]|nr:MBL fold metallo-hydrolase [Phycisphaerae bacterium]